MTTRRRQPGRAAGTFGRALVTSRSAAGGTAVPTFSCRYADKGGDHDRPEASRDRARRYPGRPPEPMMSASDRGTSRPVGGGRAPVRAERVVPPREGAELVRLRGVLDERGFEVAREAIRGALARRPDLVIVDLKGVTRMDGAGLVLLAAMQQRASQAGSRMSIVDRRRSGPRLPRVPVHATVGAALRAADRASRSARRTPAATLPARPATRDDTG